MMTIVPAQVVKEPVRVSKFLKLILQRSVQRLNIVKYCVRDCGPSRLLEKVILRVENSMQRGSLYLLNISQFINVIFYPPVPVTCRENINVLKALDNFS